MRERAAMAKPSNTLKRLLVAMAANELVRTREFDEITGFMTAGAGMFVWHEQPSFCGAICHTPMDAYYETYAEGTAGLGSTERNPHSTQHDAVPVCSDCHKAHEQSVNACTQCHNDAPVPEGWLTTSQANRLKS